MSSKNYFNNVSVDWDAMRTDFFSEKIRETVYKHVDFSSEKVIADIGAGTGFMTEGLEGKPVKVIAVDQSENMLSEMEEKLQNKIMVDYRVGESECLPIDSNTVDYVFANMYLHHVDHPQKAIQEMYRILKSGGKLIITDLDRHNYEFLRTEQHDKWLGFKRIDVKYWFASAGFNCICAVDVKENCCSESKTSNEKAEITVFMAMGEK